MKISCSFLSIQEPIKENIQKLVKTDIDYLHLDIMDGIFVPNKTWNVEDLNFLSGRKPLDIHLMVNDIYSYINQFQLLKPEFITFHYEASHDIMKVVTYLKKLNIKVGLSIKPDTAVDKIIPFLPYLDLVLVMSVNPGSGGQEFIEESVFKINALYNYRKENNLSYLISVDGGINDKTISKVKNADIVVVGSYITSGNYEERIKSLK